MVDSTFRVFVFQKSEKIAVVVSRGFEPYFYVSKKYRGMGNGKDLLNLAETYFKGNGIVKSILTTDTASIFYVKNGYSKDETITAENNDDVYVKELK